MMILLIGFLVMVFVYAGMSLLTGMGFGSTLFNVPSILLILIPIVFFFWITKNGKIMGGYLKMSFKKDHSYSAMELKAICIACGNTFRFILTIGGMGFLFGIIGALMYLEDRQMLGPNFAFSLITLLYAISFSVFMFLPLKAWAENKLTFLEGGEQIYSAP